MQLSAIRALAGLGKAYRELGKPAEAAAAFATMLELAPTDPIAPEVALARARALEADKQVDAAIKAYSVILEKFAKSNQGPQAALAQARLFAQTGRTDEAVRAFERLADDATRPRVASIGRSYPRRSACRVGMASRRCREADRSRPGLYPTCSKNIRIARMPPTPVSTWPNRPT